MTQYFNSINKFIDNIKTNKLFSILGNGYKLKNISNIDSIILLQFTKNNLFKKQIIGTINFEIKNELIHIHHLYTIKEYRNNGIATKLLEIAETYAKINNIKKITLFIHENKRNLVFYNNRGYELEYYNEKLVRCEKNKEYIQMCKKLN